VSRKGFDDTHVCTPETKYKQTRKKLGSDVLREYISGDASDEDLYHVKKVFELVRGI
jgi:hypothetical protein